MIALIVEDDEYKASDIARAVEESVDPVTLHRAGSVTSALRKITQQRFDLVLLDMSLPTFDLSGPGGGGSPQGQGGLEVLRLAKRQEHKSRFVVITQYPDIELDGVESPLAVAAGRLSHRFGVEVVKCILYQFDDDSWRSELIMALSPKDMK